MDFDNLPPNVFQKILSYLYIDHQVPIGRVNKLFREMSNLAVSQTKSIHLSHSPFRKLEPAHFSQLLHLCSKNLRAISYPWHDGKRCIAMVETFVKFSCPNLVELNFGTMKIDDDLVLQAIRNNPNAKTLVCTGITINYPEDATGGRLETLCCGPSTDATLRSLTGRCPNLKVLRTALDNVSNDVLDAFFESTPKLELLDLIPDALSEWSGIKPSNLSIFDLKHFWKLPLRRLSIARKDDYAIDDRVLDKIAVSFSDLEAFGAEKLLATSIGVAALANLKKLHTLKLRWRGEDVNNGVRRVAMSGLLREVVLWPSVTAATLIDLVRYCPGFEHLRTMEFSDVHTEEDGVALIETCFAGVRKRSVDVYVNDWKSHRKFSSLAARELIEKLWKENEICVDFSTYTICLH